MNTPIADSALPAELAIPQHRSAVIAASVIAAFLVFFVLVGIYNVFTWTALIPSILWLLLVGGSFFGFLKERGASRFLSDILGNFSCDHFAKKVVRDGTQTGIQFGYRIFGRAREYLTIPLDKIDHVHWSTGQASSMAGRDVNDWSVALWYQHGDPVKSKQQQHFRNPDLEIYIVGPTGKKEEIAAFGRALVEYLRQSGAPMAPGENDCTFVLQPLNLSPPRSLPPSSEQAENVKTRTNNMEH